MTELLVVFAIKASLLAGYYLYERFGKAGADGAYDAIATVSAAFWVLAGVFAIVGGFVVPGMILIIVFSYIGVSKGEATKRRLRSRFA